MALQRKVRFAHCRVHIESLETRAMFSVVNATPDNYLAAMQGSGNGDTIKFAPGEYDIGAGATVHMQGNRVYVGNGAVFKGGGKSVIDFGNAANAEFSGFLLDGISVSAEGASGLNFHDNTVQNTSSNGFVATDMAQSQVNNNTFKNMSGGLYGYPSSGNTVDGNTFDYVREPVHFICFNTADGMDVSGNVITHATRIGIELQNKINNLTVTNNYMSDWLQQGSGSEDSHMAISCATGGSGKAPYTDQAQHVTISGNVLIQNGPAQNVAVWAKSAIEIMGYSDIHISNNYCWNWGNYLLNGAIASVFSSTNTVVGPNLYAGNQVSWPIGGITSSGDQLFSLNDASAPAWPGVPGATAAPPADVTARGGVVPPAPKPVKAPKPKAPAQQPPAQPTLGQQLLRTIHSVLLG